MKDTRKINNLITAGIPCELAEKVVQKGLSLSQLKNRLNKRDLAQYFDEAEIEILSTLKRKPIPPNIIDRLYSESASQCCLCWQWDDKPPLIIHHIEEHSKTQDDRYENLVLLCLNHHAEVHTVWKMSRHPFPPEYVRTQKEKWIHAVTEYQAGRRSKPGTNESKPIIRPTSPPPDLYFVGRKKLLRQLVRILQAKQPAILAITGMGGIGKTSFVKKLATQVSDKYKGGIFWASLSETEGNIVSIFHTWAEICGRDISNQQDITNLASIMLSILTAYIAKNGRVLIVIDDVREYWLENAKLLKGIVPTSCSIVLTTRNQEIAVNFTTQIHNLGELSENEATKMLTSITGRLLNDSEKHSASILLQELGGLPLAVELAGKRIAVEQQKPGFSFNKFLETFRSRGTERLTIKGHNGLTTTFLITYDALASPSQIVFLQLSLFATNLIHVEQVAAVSSIDLEDIEGVLDDMVMHSLLQWGTIEGEYTIHPLLQRFSMQLFSASPEAQRKAQELYVNYFVNYVATYAEESANAHRKLDRFWPDILRTFNLIVEGKNDEIVNQLAKHLWLDSNFLYIRGYLKEAVDILQVVIQTCELNGWIDDTCRHLINLGSAYEHLGETEKSITTYLNALDLGQQINDEHIAAVCFQNLGLVYHGIGQLDQAAHYLVQALHIAEAIQDIYLSRDTISSLGSIERDLGNTESARKHYQGSLEISRKLNDKHSEGNALSNIGLTYYDEPDYEMAQKYIREGLEIARDIGDRRGEANRLGHLGNISNLTGKTEQGIKYFTQAIHICRIISHRSNEGNWLGNLGNSHRLLGNSDKAIEYFKQALDISREVQSSKQSIIWLLNLGDVYFKSDQWDLAVQHFEEAAILSITLGDYENHQLALGRMANIYSFSGNFERLIDCYERQLKASQEVNDLKVSNDLRNLIGLSLLHNGKIEESKEYLQQALLVSREIEDKTTEADCLNNLGLHARNTNDFTVAIEFYEEALNCYGQIENREGEGISLAEMGVVYISSGDYDQAVEKLNQALEIFRNLKFTPKFAYTLGNLGNVYYFKGNIEKAIDFHDQALELSQAIQDKPDTANWLGALGQDYLRQENYDKAKDYCTQCLLLSQEMGVPSLEARCLKNLAVIYAETSQLDLSDRYLQDALIIARQLNDDQLECICLLYLGSNFLERNNLDQSQIHFGQALNAAQASGNRFREAQVLWQLGLLYERTNKIESAFKCLEQAKSIYAEYKIDLEQSELDKLNEIKFKLNG